MGLSTSLFTGLSGLNSNARSIEVTGNNIANANTVGFKSSRVSFETQLSQTIGSGRAPSAELGGTNPSQVGLGSRTASITRDFSTGSIQPTGVNTDIAIEGNGFFIVKNGGEQFYTRAGNFSIDSNFNLVTSAGALVQGFGVDDDFKVAEGQLTNINIPLGQLTLVEPTTYVRMAGNLNAAGDAATGGSLTDSVQLFSDAAGTALADAATALSSLFLGNGTPVLADGDVITMEGATRGGSQLASKTFQVGATNTTQSDDIGTTMQDFMDFLQDVFGVQSVGTAGVTMNDGKLTIEGNGGTVNNLVIDTSDLIVNRNTNPRPLVDLNKQRDADGESVRTSFITYDSLGTEATVDLSIVLEEQSNAGTRWSFYVQSEDDTDLDRALGRGELRFDQQGRLLSASDTTFLIDHEGTGAFTPQSIEIRFEDEFSSITALADTRSQVAAIQNDGAALGVLEDFSVTEDGTIVGSFSNSLRRDIGRVALATFTNPLGLVETSGSLFIQTPNSGNAAIVTAGSGGAGRILGATLELSNVDLSQEFINLISASTGFNANSRVLSTSDELFQQLLATIR